MKITTETSIVKKPISAINEVVPSRTTLQSLEYIQISTGKQGFQLCATDLEVDAVISIKTKAQKEEKLLVNSNRLNSFIQSLPDGELILESTDKKLLLKSGKINSGLLQLPEELPSVRKDFVPIDSFTMIAGDLQSAIRGTIFAVSNNEFRPAMTGVLFHIQTKTIRLVATDGHKLAMFTQSHKSKEEYTLVCPVKALNLVLKHVLPEDEITVSFSKERMLFETEKMSFCTKLIDEPFPNYEAIIPQNELDCIVGRKDLHAALKRSFIFADGELRQIRFIVSKDAITIKAEVDNENSEEVVPCDYDGEEITYGFNASNMADCLNNLQTDYVKFKLNSDNKKSQTIFNHGESKSDQLMLMMPM